MAGRHNLSLHDTSGTQIVVDDCSPGLQRAIHQLLNFLVSMCGAGRMSSVAAFAAGNPDQPAWSKMGLLANDLGPVVQPVEDDDVPFVGGSTAPFVVRPSSPPACPCRAAMVRSTSQSHSESFRVLLCLNWSGR